MGGVAEGGEAGNGGLGAAGALIDGEAAARSINGGGGGGGIGRIRVNTTDEAGIWGILSPGPDTAGTTTGPIPTLPLPD